MNKRKLADIVSDFQSTNVYQATTSAVTDIGGMSENQDDCFTIKINSQNIVIVGVLDGHGKENGKLMTTCAKQSLSEYFSNPDVIAELVHNTYACLANAFEVANQAVKFHLNTKQSKSPTSVSIPLEVALATDSSAYRSVGESGMENTDAALFSNGGVVCTVMSYVNGIVTVAGVGDVIAMASTLLGDMPGSTSLSHQSFATNCDLRQDSALKFLGDIAAEGDRSRNEGMSRSRRVVSGIPGHTDSLLSYLLSDIHVPDNPNEFARLSCYVPKSDVVGAPLRLVYDSGMKYPGYVDSLKDIFVPATAADPDAFSIKKFHPGRSFEAESTDSYFKPSLLGSVRKNVRGDYATLAVGVVPLMMFNSAEIQHPKPVTLDSSSSSCAVGPRSPVSANTASLLAISALATYPYCLSCTRSIGDFPLTQFGITHKPTILSLNLANFMPQFKVVSTDSQTKRSSYQSGVNYGQDRIAALAAVASSFEEAVSDIEDRRSRGRSVSFCTDFVSSPTRVNILLATDGVWDNWKYEDVGRFIWDKQEEHIVMQRQRIQQQLVGDQAILNLDFASANKYAVYCFMKANKERSLKLFGSDTDNATAVLTCLFPVPS